MFLPLKDVIARTMKKSGMQAKITTNQVLHVAESEIAKMLSAKVGKPVKVRGDYFKQSAVYCTVPSGVMAEEVRLNDAKLMESINKHLGGQSIKHLRVVVGTID